MTAETKTCVMCERPVGPKGVTYTLTDAERHIMRVLLTEDSDVHFCRACDHLSKDPKAFAEFMKGVKLTRMRASGVPLPIAERVAQKEYDFYLKKALDSLAKNKPAS